MARREGGVRAAPLGEEQIELQVVLPVADVAVGNLAVAVEGLIVRGDTCLEAEELGLEIGVGHAEQIIV